MPLLARRAASATERTLVYFRMTMYMRPPCVSVPASRIKAYRAAAGLGPTCEMGQRRAYETAPLIPIFLSTGPFQCSWTTPFYGRRCGWTIPSVSPGQPGRPPICLLAALKDPSNQIFGDVLKLRIKATQIRPWCFRRSRKMLARKIIAILLSLTALGLSACQGNRLNGSTSSSVATEVSGFLPLGGQA
jgi:hypothetical protein